MKLPLQIGAALLVLAAAAAPAETGAAKAPAPAKIPDMQAAAAPATVTAKSPAPAKIPDMRPVNQSPAPTKTAKTPKPRSAPTKTAKTPKPPARPAEPAYIGSAFAAMRGGFLPARDSGGTLFFSGASSLRLIPEKRYCLVNGVRVYQCFPTRRRHGGVQVSHLEALKTFAPLSARRIGVVRHRVAVVTLDPGHGGRDRGAAGRVLREKIATLLLSFRVAAILRRCGYQVHLTRSGDSYVPLPERCLIQRRHGSDIFVSIHVNAAARKDLQGIEVFALTPAGAASTSGGEPSPRIYGGNLLDANNLLLAYQIHRALLRRTGAVDRGVKRARFAVLRDISVPGVLVEVGFISNPREERLLLDPAYREKIARGIAEGIIHYHRALPPPPPTPGKR